MNKKGEIVTGVLLTGIVIASIAGIGFYKTHRNGVLKNNGKKIWCKMQNKGADFCNAAYEFTPQPYHWEFKVPVYVEGEA